MLFFTSNFLELLIMFIWREKNSQIPKVGFLLFFLSNQNGFFPSNCFDVRKNFSKKFVKFDLEIEIEKLSIFKSCILKSMIFRIFTEKCQILKVEFFPSNHNIWEILIQKKFVKELEIAYHVYLTRKNSRIPKSWIFTIFFVKSKWLFSKSWIFSRQIVLISLSNQGIFTSIIVEFFPSNRKVCFVFTRKIVKSRKLDFSVKSHVFLTCLL